MAIISLAKALVSAGQPHLADRLAVKGIEPQLVDVSRATQLSGYPRCTILIHREPVATAPA